VSLRLLILSDSLALPRTEPEFCSQRETWPELLRSHGHQVTQVSIGGATTHDLLKQCFYYRKECLGIDAVIVQAGIVDCAPRFAGKLELKAYQAIPVIGKRIIKGLNRNWVRKARKISYVGPEKFKKNIAKIVANYSPLPVLLIGIVPAAEAYEKKLSGVTRNIGRYNEILEAAGTFLSLSEIPSTGIMSDHHHLNAAGHSYVAQLAEAKIAGLKITNAAGDGER
jgi:hypothetical protein